MYVIRLKNCAFFARHGVLDEEEALGQRFYVDAVLSVEPGRALVDDAMRRAGFGGARAMHVIANPLAEAFYRACGFVYSGEAKTQFGTARTMRRALESGTAAV